MRATLVDSGGDGRLSIWSYPVPGRDYVIGADPAEGKVRDMGSAAKRDMILSTSGSRPDYSAAVVLEMSTGHHVATWHGSLSAVDFAVVCMALGFYYNTAFMIWEHNNQGVVLTESFVQQHYPRIYRRRIMVGKIPTKSPLQDEWGWVTSGASKPHLTALIHQMLKHNRHFTRDAALIDELRTFERDPATGEERSRGRNKDDRVLALGMALEARYQYLQEPNESVQDDRIKKLDAIERRVWLENIRPKNHGNDPAGNRARAGPRLGELRDRDVSANRLGREALGRELLRRVVGDRVKRAGVQPSGWHPDGFPRPVIFREGGDPQDGPVVRQDDD